MTFFFLYILLPAIVSSINFINITNDFLNNNINYLKESQNIDVPELNQGLQMNNTSNMKTHVKLREHIKRDLLDMPSKEDLKVIFNSLYKVLDFFLKRENDVDTSVNYGLFLVDVNLRKVYKSKRFGLPAEVGFHLRRILEKNQKLLKFFSKMVEEDDNSDDITSKTLTSLVKHDRLWMSRVEEFNGARVNKTETEEYETLEKTYSNWEEYVEAILDYSRASPNPEQSDMCLANLANNNHASKDSWKKKCHIPDSCRQVLTKGSDFGYGLTHRVLYLQQAYYGYRCYVFSNLQDLQMRDMFCKKLYSEATYISLNNFGAIDLFAEQICICALDGHFQFLRRSWLHTIMQHQIKEGCFSDSSYQKRSATTQSEPYVEQNWRLNKGENQYVLGGKCNAHTSSAAAASLALGVKFILETYY